MPTLWIGIILSATAIGFAVGHLRGRGRRWLTLVGLLVTPALVLTVALALMPPAPPGFIAWWLAGLVMIGPALVAWAVFATAGFVVARYSIG